MATFDIGVLFKLADLAELKKTPKQVAAKIVRVQKHKINKLPNLIADIANLEEKEFD